MAVAVAILLEVAVDAVHALVEMDVGQVDGFLELLRVFEIYFVIVLVQPVAFAIVLEDGAVDPAVAVEIGELGLLVAAVEVAYVTQEFGVAPLAFERSGFGIAQQRNGGILRFPDIGFWRIHAVAVGLVVPPHVAEILGGVGCAGMYVADHALAGRDGARQTVLYGVALLVLWDRGIAGGAVAQVAARGIGAGVRRIAIVGVD